MANVPPIKFTDAFTENEFRRMCKTHGISFEFIEEQLHEDYHIVEPGTVDLNKIEIGKDRVFENPSKALDTLFYQTISVVCQFVGRPLKKAPLDFSHLFK